MLRLPASERDLEAVCSSVVSRDEFDRGKLRTLGSDHRAAMAPASGIDAVRSDQIDPEGLCGDYEVDLGASPHPFPDVGNGPRCLYLVELPGRRVVSDQAAFSKRDEGR
jgi:hypothetical protein